MASRRRQWLTGTRRRVRLSQEQLAYGIGVDPMTISRWERGVVGAIELRHHEPLAEALHVTVEDLSLWEGDYQAGIDATGGVSVPGEPGGLQSELWHTTGSAGTLAELIDQLETVALTSTGPERGRHLRLLGYTHRTLGENAFDQLRFVTAAGHFQQMQELGFEIDDPDLVTLAFTYQADVARRRRRYRTAFRLFAASETHAHAATSQVQARRWQTMARAHAERGERTQFLDTIDRAEQRAAEPTGDIAPGVATDPISVRHERAHGLTLLGDPAEALRIYEQHTPNPTSGRDRTNFTIIKAQAMAHAGDLGEGIAMAITGVTEARAFGSARLVSRVQRFYDRLLTTHPANDPHMLDLRDALAA